MNCSSSLVSTDAEPRPLADDTWFGLGGPARHRFRPGTRAELASVLRSCRSRGLPFRVLGRGANVLVSDEGFDGAVIQLIGPEFTRVVFTGETVLAGAGVDIQTLIRRTSERGLAGLETLGGIPGTVGGCVRMNAGGRFGEIGQVVRRVHVMDEQGRDQWLEKQRVGFAYRRTDLGGWVVIAAELALTRDDPKEIRKRLLKVWSYKQESQPLADHSAGCIFRNPPGDSAGRLIDRAGLKGMRCGSARVAEEHANFIVADKGATAGDVIELIRRVRQKVYEKYEVQLELEIDVWGEDAGLGRRGGTRA